MNNRHSGGIRRRIGLVLLLALLGSAAMGQQKIWTLSECIARALGENILLNQSIANNEGNAINLAQSKAAALPNLNLSDQQSFNNGRSVNNQYGQSSQFTSTNSLGLTSTITLYNGARLHNQVKQNSLNYDAGKFDIEKQKNDLELNVIAAYMQLLLAYEAVNVAGEQIDATNEHLKYTELYVRAGSLPESNLLQMRAQLATDKAARVEAENQLQVSKVVLQQYMELPVGADFEIKRPVFKELLPEVVRVPAEIYGIAEAFLPEIKSAGVKTRAAEAGLRVSESGLKPKLTLSGNLSTYYSSASSLTAYQTNTVVQQIGYLTGNPSETVSGPVTNVLTQSSDYPFFRQFGDNFGQGVSLNLSVPIFNNLLYKSDIKRAQVAINVAKLNERYIKNQLRKNIEVAYTDQLAAMKNYIATREQLVAEETSYKNVTVKFRAGVINTTDFFVEKTIYNRAQLAHLQAKYQYLFKTQIVNFYLNNPITE